MAIVLGTDVIVDFVVVLFAGEDNFFGRKNKKVKTIKITTGMSNFFILKSLTLENNKCLVEMYNLRRDFFFSNNLPDNLPCDCQQNKSQT